jgi:hypothetical protein
MAQHGFMQVFKGKIASWYLVMATKDFHLAAANTITAHAGGTRALATKLTASLNRISVCATAGDSVALPPAVAGLDLLVINDGAAAGQVFADAGTTDTIDGVAAATGVPLTNAARARFSAPADGVWSSMAGAKSS